MPRPIALFTGQWAGLTLDDVVVEREDSGMDRDHGDAAFQGAP